MIKKKRQGLMKTYYSLDTMNDRVLCRTFNYHAVSSPLRRSIIKLVRRIKGKRDYYTLGDVYNFFKQGQSVQDIWYENPQISMKAILIGRAFFAYLHPERYKIRKSSPQIAMIDENIGVEHVVEGAAQVFGASTHVAFKGLIGAKDARLWGYLRANGIRVLVTKDKAVKESRNTKETMDITRCAILSWERRLKQNGGIVDDEIRNLPVIIHVPYYMNPTQIKNLLRKHADTIHEIQDECVSPVITLTKNKAKPGIHFMEIISDGYKKQVEKLRDMRVNTIIAGFDVSGMLEEELKKLQARLKRGVEHEISVELQLRDASKDKILHLLQMERDFSPETYKHSMDDESLRQAVKAATVGDKYSIPTWQRYGRPNPASA